MSKEPTTNNSGSKTFLTLPEEYTKKKSKGKPYAFYSYRHYEVYPGDVFFSVYQGKLIFARAMTKRRFEPFGVLDFYNGTQKLPYDDVIDMTNESLPTLSNSGRPAGQETLKLFKESLTALVGKGFVEGLDGGSIVEMVRKSFDDDSIVLKFGLFRKGSIKGKQFELPEKLQNEPHIILTGLEKDFMEPYFEITISNKLSEKKGCVPAVLGEDASETLIFRKINSLSDFFTLLDEGKPELLLSSDSIKARISYPYHYISAEWVNGTYKCMRGTEYDLKEIYWFFARQFGSTVAMSIVNFKQQMMPYYQKYFKQPIPKDLSREDILFLSSKWFVQDVRSGLYYRFAPTIKNADGSYFCLDEKWFSLLYDRVRRYGKKEACDTDTFKFRSSKDKAYFQLFSLEEDDLAYAFETAIDDPDFESFFQKMNLRFNPFVRKQNDSTPAEPIRLTDEQRRRIEAVLQNYYEDRKKAGN